MRDNGIGITAADQTAIFDRFFRAHAHLDQELGVSGTGLGLAIVGRLRRGARRRHPLRVADGDGTAFYITLPLTTPASR